jgi:hypothetical protein
MVKRYPLKGKALRYHKVVAFGIALAFQSRALDESVRMIEELGLVEQWQQRVTSEL